MAHIRPEVLAFIRAAQTLISGEEAGQPFPLSDEETEKMVKCMIKLEKLLQDGEGRLDGDGHVDGDGHP